MVMDTKGTDQLNMSLDFVNMDITKNYMRLTTSANKRYQTAVNFKT